jgi:hypothetical protein
MVRVRDNQIVLRGEDNTVAVEAFGKTHEEQDANAIRVSFILSAADGMTTEEAVNALEFHNGNDRFYAPIPKNMTPQEAIKYLEHGPEMVEFIKDVDDYCSCPEDSVPHSIRSGAANLVSKLDAK